jgi:hypothetical protein
MSYVGVESNVIERIGKIDFICRVDPSFNFHCTQLIIEWIEDHIKSTRNGIDSARLPTDKPRVSNGYHESLVMVFIKQLVGTDITKNKELFQQ